MGRKPGPKTAAKTPAPKKSQSTGGSSRAQTQFTDTAEPPPKSNVPPALIAKALTEMLDFDTRIASLAGLKGAAITRYEQQGVDREYLAALNRLGRKGKDDAMAFIMGLTQYAIAAEVIPPPADDRWTMSVKQVDLFAPAAGEVAEELRMARARKEGWQAGRKGFAIESNPYNAKPGSPEFVGWRDGLVDGLKLRAQIKPGSENTEKPPAAPAPRKRAATAAPTPPPEKTALQTDEEAYRAKGVSGLH